MRNVLMIIGYLAFANPCIATDVVSLSVDGVTNHEIVIADNASVEVQVAAAELSMFLEQVCPLPDAFFYDWMEVKSSSITRSKKKILVGRSKALDELALDIDWDALGDEGFVIRTAGPHLVIAGGPRRGTINGVYTFLEEIVGVRWFTATVTYIPHKPNLTIDPTNIQKVPVFEIRGMLSGPACNIDWAARQRLNMFSPTVAKRLEDGVRSQWGLFINDPKMTGCHYYAGTSSHTLGHDTLLPTAAFDTHPEYFALVDGKRTRDGQPCLTNQHVHHLVADNAKIWLKNDPLARVISLSLGDYAKFCQCGPCKASMQEYGRSGYVLHFVNQVANKLEHDYPHVLVSTLAYHWFTRTPPKKHIDAHKNVVIRFAPIYASAYSAYDEGEYNIDQRVYPHLVEWSNIASRVWIWSYFLADSDLHPFAMFNCLNRNFNLFRELGVNGFTHQADVGHMNMAGGVTELLGYLLAKLMWDPDYDVQKGIEEFCVGVYGNASPYIISYIRQVNDISTYDAILSDKRKHSNYEPLKYDKMLDLDRLFDEAEQTVVNDPEMLERVKFVRLSLQYAIISHAPDGDPLRNKAITNFFTVAKRAAIPALYSKKSRKSVRLSVYEQHVTSVAPEAK